MCQLSIMIQKTFTNIMTVKLPLMLSEMSTLPPPNHSQITYVSDHTEFRKISNADC